MSDIIKVFGECLVDLIRLADDKLGILHISGWIDCLTALGLIALAIFGTKLFVWCIVALSWAIC